MPTPAPFERTRTQAWRAFASVLPRVLAVIFAVEALVMVVLDRLPPMRPGLEAAVDAATLSLLSGSAENGGGPGEWLLTGTAGAGQVAGSLLVTAGGAVSLA